MGYTTDFDGQITVEPPLNAEEIDFLNRFTTCRRVHRKSGPYFASDDPKVLKNYGQSDSDDFRSSDAFQDDIIDYNEPHPGEPGLWCQWIPLEDGTAIEWDEGEKFYHAEDWMKYLIDHFIGSDPIAKKIDPERFKFLQGHVCNGEIEAQGEDSDDRWVLIVENNVVMTAIGEWNYAAPVPLQPLLTAVPQQ